MKFCLVFAAFAAFVLSTKVQRRLQFRYAAYLLNEHLGFQERIIANTAIRPEDFQHLIKNIDPDKEWKNRRSLKRFDELVKNRINYFLKRSSDLVQGFLQNMTRDEKVDPEIVKHIDEERNKIATEAKQFFLREMPRHLHTLISDVGILDVRRMANESTRTTLAFAKPVAMRTSSFSMRETLPIGIDLR